MESSGSRQHGGCVASACQILCSVFLWVKLRLVEQNLLPPKHWCLLGGWGGFLWQLQANLKTKGLGIGKQNRNLKPSTLGYLWHVGIEIKCKYNANFIFMLDKWHQSYFITLFQQNQPFSWFCKSSHHLIESTRIGQFKLIFEEVIIQTMFFFSQLKKMYIFF